MALSAVVIDVGFPLRQDARSASPCVRHGGSQGVERHGANVPGGTDAREVEAATMPLIAVGGGNRRRDPPRQSMEGRPVARLEPASLAPRDLAPWGSVARLQSQAGHGGRRWDRRGRWAPDILRGTTWADDGGECPVRDGRWPVCRSHRRGTRPVSLEPRRPLLRVLPGDRGRSAQHRRAVAGPPLRQPVRRHCLRPDPRRPFHVGAAADRLWRSGRARRGAATGLVAERPSAAAARLRDGGGYRRGARGPRRLAGLDTSGDRPGRPAGAARHRGDGDCAPGRRRPDRHDPGRRP